VGIRDGIGIAVGPLIDFMRRTVMSGIPNTSAATSPVPHRWTDNFLFGLAWFAAILLVPMAAFVVWGVWPRQGVDEMEALARGYAVITTLFVMLVMWVVGLAAALVGKMLETRPGRQRGFRRLLWTYAGWVAVAAVYLWYANTF
jgi:hypothetical protein